jgi:hypothetical protein
MASSASAAPASSRVGTPGPSSRPALFGGAVFGGELFSGASK